MLDKLNSYVQATRRWAKDLAYRVKNNLVWGYGHCVTEGDEELREYYVAIKKLRDQELSTGICICNEELEKILWGAAKRLGPACISSPALDYQRTDSIDKALWVIQNPGCVAYETWAEQYQALCAQLNLDVKATQIKCADVGLDIFVAQKITCSRIELLLEVEKKACQISADVLVERMEACKIQVQTEVMPKVCDIDFHTAVRAVACGVGIATLVSVFSCDVTLNPVVTEPDCPPDTVEANIATAACKPGCSCDDIDCGSPCPALLQDKPGPPEADIPNLVEFIIPDITVKCGDCEFQLPASVWANVNFSVAIDFGEIVVGTGVVALGDLVSCADPQYAACCASGYTASLSIASTPLDPPITINDCEYRTLTVTFTDSCGNTVVCSRPWGEITC